MEYINKIRSYIEENPSRIKIILVILTIVLLWRIVDHNMLLVVGISLIGYSLYKHKEGFNEDGTEFVEWREPKYGLRGELLNVRPVVYPEPLDYHCTNKCYQ